MIDLDEEARDAQRDPGEPSLARDAVAFAVVFVALPCLVALVMVGAYLAVAR